MKLPYYKALAYTTVIVAILAGVFLAMQTVTSTLPEPIKSFAVTFFQIGPVAFGLAWVRNLYGFLTARAHAKAAGTNIQFETQKFHATVGYYAGFLTLICEASPSTEIRAIGTVIVIIVDFLGASIAAIFPPAT